eukprot:1806664-Rhodomonas_salina.1
MRLRESIDTLIADTFGGFGGVVDKAHSDLRKEWKVDSWEQGVDCDCEKEAPEFDRGKCRCRGWDWCSECLTEADYVDRCYCDEEAEERMPEVNRGELLEEHTQALRDVVAKAQELCRSARTLAKQLAQTLWSSLRDTIRSLAALGPQSSRGAIRWCSQLADEGSESDESLDHENGACDWVDSEDLRGVFARTCRQ